MDILDFGREIKISKNKFLTFRTSNHEAAPNTHNLLGGTPCRLGRREFSLPLMPRIGQGGRNTPSASMNMQRHNANQDGRSQV